MWRGAAANVAESAASSLQQQRIGIGEADRAVFPIIEAARAADADSRLRLTQIRHEISVGMAALRPSMDTPAGRRQLVEFLDAKAAEARHVSENAQSNSSRIAADLANLGNEYDAQATSRGNKPASTTDDEDRDGAAASVVRDSSGEPKPFMASWGPRPLSPADTAPPAPAPGPAPRPSGPVPAELPAPLQDFTNYQLQGQEVPPWAPPPPPQTGEPIKLAPPAPRPPAVITLDDSPAELVDLFPNCDNGDVAKAGAQLVGAGIGAAIAASAGPMTAGITWAGLGAAGIAIGDAIDTLATCKGVS